MTKIDDLKAKTDDQLAEELTADCRRVRAPRGA